MTVLDWSTVGKRNFETGVDRGVLYVGNSPGVVWAGLISISDAPTGGDAEGHYIDGVKYSNRSTPSEFAGTINAYSSPEEFDVCEGIVDFFGIQATDQPKKPFGLCYRTLIGDDVAGTNKGYKLHLIYNALAGNNSKEYSTISESTNPSELSWPITAKPISLPGMKPTAHLIIDSRNVDPDLLRDLEDILYGTSTTEPHLPTFDELLPIISGPPVDTTLWYDGGGPGTPVIPAYRASSGAAQTSSNAADAWTIVIPAETRVGDFMLLSVVCNDTQPPVVSAGWTLTAQSPETTGTRHLGNYLYERIASSGDAGAVVTITTPAAIYAAAVIYVASGVDNNAFGLTPFVAVGTHIVLPDVDTTTENTLLVYLCGAAASSTASVETVTWNSGPTSRRTDSYDFHVSAFAVADELAPTAGTSTPRSFDVLRSSDVAGWVVGLSPDPLANEIDLMIEGGTPFGGLNVIDGETVA